jgi:hypothetical protein
MELKMIAERPHLEMNAIAMLAKIHFMAKSSSLKRMNTRKLESLTVWVVSKPAPVPEKIVTINQ